MPPPVSLDADELLTLTIRNRQASAMVIAAGEVDSFSAPQLADALAALLASAPREVTVDLDAVSFLDSAGVHVLAQTYRAAAAAGINLTVLASRRAVTRPLQLTGLWALLSPDFNEPRAIPS